MEKNNCGKEREELINCFMFFGKEMMFTNYECREYFGQFKFSNDSDPLFLIFLSR